MPTRTVPVRLAFRVEGDFWCAYLAKTDSLENALLLGSIRLSIVVVDEAHKQAFMDLMKAILAEAVEQVTPTVGTPAQPTVVSGDGR